MQAHSAVLTDWPRVIRDEPRLTTVFQRVTSGHLGHRIPEELVGDFLVLLGAGRQLPKIETHSTDHYGNLLRKVIRGRRWKSLVLRLAMLKRLARKDLSARATRGNDAGAWEAALVFAVEYLVQNFVKNVKIDSVSLEGLALVDHIAGIQLQNWAGVSRREIAVRDPSMDLVDDYMMVLTELASKARVFDALHVWVNRELIKQCLAVEWKLENFEPRQLELVRREGDSEIHTAGEKSAVRSITKKIREDQIPKIIPTEFALLGHANAETGRMLTLDKIFNGAPLIQENYNPETPEIRHRICLPIIIGATAEMARFDPRHHPANRIRLLAFELLTHLALQMPHDKIHADVVWFDYQPESSGDRDGNRWDASIFPLRSLSVTAAKDLRTNNVLQVNKLLPTFFTKGKRGGRLGLPVEVRKLHATPSTFLHGAVAAGDYRGIFPAVLTVRDRRNPCLPPPSTQLPRPGGEKQPHVLVVNCNWREPDSDQPRNQIPETYLEALFAADLVSAWTTMPPYSVSNSHAIITRYLEMVIGPCEKPALLPSL